MAFVTPTNVATGEVLTASRYNQDVVENFTAIGGAWTAYTPTWSGVTLGSSPTQNSAYIAAGKFHIVRISLTLGTGGSVTGAVQATLPNGVSLNSGYNANTRIGIGTATDASPAANLILSVAPVSGDYTRVRFTVLNASATYVFSDALSGTVPFTWTTGDQLSAQFVFEAA